MWFVWRLPPESGRQRYECTGNSVFSLRHWASICCALTAAADDHYRLLMAQHQEQMRQNEAEQQRYQVQLQSYRDNGAH